MTATASRQTYMDVLKGIAIYMVVMGHVITLCIRDIDSTFLFRIIAEIHMPLFFFISGWYSFKFRPDSTPFKAPDMLRRAMQLLVPMAVVSSAWIFLYRHSGLQCPFDSTWKGLWVNTSKNGYWFTLCLFEIIAIYYALSYVMRRIRTTARILLLIAVWALLLFVSSKFRGGTWWGILELELVPRFFPVFMAGVMLRMYEQRFFDTIERPGIYSALLASGGVLLYAICYPAKFGITDGLIEIIRSIFHITIAAVAIVLAKGWTDSANAPYSLPIRLWSYLGRESLTIYLLHYLMLFPMDWMQEPMRAAGLGFVPAAVISGITAAAIIGCTLLVNIPISRSPLFALLLTGKINFKRMTKPKLSTI